MTWTYANNPGTDTAERRRDFVRFNLGDTDTNDQLVTDEEIAAALAEASNDVYLATAIVARAIAAQFMRASDISMGEGALAISDRAIADGFLNLATRMERQAKKYGTVDIGVPAAGGLTESELKALDEDPDWNSPRFRERQFENPRHTENHDAID